MNKKTVIHTTKAPSSTGPYAQAVAYNGLMFLSGQTAVDPETNMLISGGIEDQTRRVMENLQAILEAGGLDFSHVIRTTVYLKNMSDYHVVNEIYGEYFDDYPPARSVMEVSRLAQDAIIEIDAIAAVPEAALAPAAQADDYDESSNDAGGDHDAPDDRAKEEKKEQPDGSSF